MSKVLTGLLKGINEFIKDYGVYPHMAVMHPETLQELEGDLKKVPVKLLAEVNRAIKRTELLPSPRMEKDSIVFLMRDKSL